MIISYQMCNVAALQPSLPRIIGATKLDRFRERHKEMRYHHAYRMPAIPLAITFVLLFVPVLAINIHNRGFTVDGAVVLTQRSLRSQFPSTRFILSPFLNPFTLF